MGKYVEKSFFIKAAKLWGSCVCAYYVNLQFSHAYTRPFCPTNYKKITNIFNVVTKQKQTETQNALYNFSESPHIFRSSGYMAWCIMRLVHFAHIYTACGLLLFVSVAGQAVLCVLGLYGR